MVYTKIDFVDGDYVNAKTLSDDDGYNTLNNNANVGTGLLGEIRQFDISRTNAVSKATLQGQGWAICDGTTPADQGITSPTITTTPDLREKFLRHSADETTGGTGGSLTHNHRWGYDPAGGATNEFNTYQSNGTTEQDARQEVASGTGKWTVKVVTGNNYYTKLNDSGTSLPPYYDICYFIKVK